MHESNAAVESVSVAPPAKIFTPDAGKPRPVVVALIGLPGSGKSAVAQAVAEQLGMRRVSRDAIRDAMFPHCSYSFAEKRAAFRAVLLALEINCVLGESSVIDGMTFSRRRDLARVDAAIKNYGFMPIPVFLDCAVETARSRITEQLVAQPTLAHERSPESAAAARARFDTPPPNSLVVNANLPLADVSRIVVAAIAQLRAT